MLVFATGVKDIFPTVEGFAECWGKSIIHCPYCHGYEYRDKKTAIWINQENASHLAPLIHNLTDKLTILTNGEVDLPTEEHQQLIKNGIEIVEKAISAIGHENGQIQFVIFNDGTKLPLNALYAGPAFEQHCPIPAALGCEITEKGYIKTDMFFKTSIDGVYACGDNVSPFRSVANAVANGNFTGAAINRELAMATFGIL